MMTADKVALGMKAHLSMRKARQRMTSAPVYTPPSGVRTPLALFTAVREKEPVVGIELTKEPITLQTPSAIISWLASTGFPPAADYLIKPGTLKYSTALTKCLSNGDALKNSDDRDDND